MKYLLLFVGMAIAAIALPALVDGGNAQADSDIARQMTLAERDLAKAQADVRAAKSLAAIATANANQANAQATRQAVGTAQALASQRQAIASQATVAAMNAGIAQSQATAQAAEVETTQHIQAAMRQEQLAAIANDTAKANQRLYGWLAPLAFAVMVGGLCIVGIAFLNALASVKIAREQFKESSGGVLNVASGEYVRRELPAWSDAPHTIEGNYTELPTLPQAEAFRLNTSKGVQLILKEKPTDRPLALALLRDVMQATSNQARAIVGTRQLKEAGREWSGEKWGKAIEFLKAYGLTKEGRGWVSPKPLRELYAEVSMPRLYPTLQATHKTAQTATRARTERANEPSEPNEPSAQGDK
jgi:hypothetical protein